MLSRVAIETVVLMTTPRKAGGDCYDGLDWDQKSHKYDHYHGIPTIFFVPHSGNLYARQQYRPTARI